MSKNISRDVSNNFQPQNCNPKPASDLPTIDAGDSPRVTNAAAVFFSAAWLGAISGGAIAFVTSVAAQWLIYDYWLGGKGLRLADPSIAAVAVTLFVRHLGNLAHKSKLADLRRFAVIGEMNHHIRNALQVLVYQPFLGDGQSEIAQQAIKRIEWVLTEVLPAVRDENIANNANVTRD
jgi:hypothetical protein